MELKSFVLHTGRALHRQLASQQLKVVKVIYWCLFSLIIFIGLVLRLYPAIGNNFYFTMDQGNDAVHAREIIDRGQILLVGPETGIKGIYHGPFWYYFIAVGFVVTGGHPFGPVLMLIILNVATSAILMLIVAKKVSKSASLLIGFSLQFFWWFYEASRYGFNPFPLVSLSIIMLLLVSDFLERTKKGILKPKFNSFVLAAVPVGLAFHSESAAAIAFLIFYFSVAIWLLFKKRLNLGSLLIAIIVLSMFFIPRLISEMKTNFSQTKVLARELSEPKGVFSETEYNLISEKFKEIITKRITPQSNEVGIAILIIVTFLFMSTPVKNHFSRRFAYLTLMFVLISWIWFGSNKGWQVWHTVYIRPILFIAILLMLIEIRGKLATSFLVIILISQLFFFKDRYLQFAKLTNDPSILANELAAIDWVYQKAESEGFYVYTYLPSVYDYNYQYLFWWHGKNSYGYVPCEYSTFPNTPSIFVPGLKYYQQPKRDCTNMRFLIVEPDKNKFLRNKWLEQVRRDSELLESTNVGDIQIEKRKINAKL